MSRKLIDSICFYFDDVLKKDGQTEPVPHSIPMLYRQFGKYDKVFIYDPDLTPEHIKQWISHHDMQWRQCCHDILNDPKEDSLDKACANFTLNCGPLVPTIHFPKEEPRCSVYVMKHAGNKVKVTSIVPMEAYKEW